MLEVSGPPAEDEDAPETSAGDDQSPSEVEEAPSASEREILWVIEGTADASTLRGSGEALVIEYDEGTDQERTLCAVTFAVASTGTVDCDGCELAFALSMTEFEVEADTDGACMGAGIDEATAASYSPLAIRGEQVLHDDGAAWVPLDSYAEYDAQTGEVFLEWRAD